MTQEEFDRLYAQQTQAQQQPTGQMAISQFDDLYESVSSDLGEDAYDATAESAALSGVDQPFADFVRGVATGGISATVGLPMDFVANLVQGAGALYGLITGPSIEDIAAGRAKAPETLDFVLKPREEIFGTTESIQAGLRALGAPDISQQGISPTSSVGFAAGAGVGGALSFQGVQQLARQIGPRLAAFTGSPLDSAKALLAEASIAGGISGAGQAAGNIAGETTIGGVPIAPLVSAGTELAGGGVVQGVSSMYGQRSADARMREAERAATKAVVRQFAPTDTALQAGLNSVDMPVQQYDAIRSELLQLLDQGMQQFGGAEQVGYQVTPARAIAAAEGTPFSRALTTERLLLDNPQMAGVLASTQQNNVTNLLAQIREMNPQQGNALMLQEEVQRALQAEKAAIRDSLEGSVAAMRIPPEKIQVYSDQAKTRLENLLSSEGKPSQEALGKAGRDAFNSAYAKMKQEVNDAYNSITSEERFVNPKPSVRKMLASEFGDEFLTRSAGQIESIINRFDLKDGQVDPGDAFFNTFFGDGKPAQEAPAKAAKGTVGFQAMNEAMKELNALRIRSWQAGQAGDPQGFTLSRAAKKARQLLMDQIESQDRVAAQGLRDAQKLRMRQGLVFESGAAAKILADGMGMETRVPDEDFYRGFLNSGKARDVDRFLTIFGGDKATMSAANDWMVRNLFDSVSGKEGIRQQKDAFRKFLDSPNNRLLFQKFPELRQRAEEGLQTADNIYSLAQKLENYSDQSIASLDITNEQAIRLVEGMKGTPQASAAIQGVLSNRLLDNLLRGTDAEGNTVIARNWRPVAEKFMRDNSALMKAFPEVKENAERLLASSKSLEEFQSRLNTGVTRYFAAAKDPSMAVKNWLNSKNKIAEAKDLAGFLKSNEDLKPLFRDALFEHMFKIGGGDSAKGSVLVNDLNTFLRDRNNEPLTKLLVSEKDREQLKLLSKFFTVEERFNASATRGSQTAPLTDLQRQIDEDMNSFNNYGIGIVKRTIDVALRYLSSKAGQVGAPAMGEAQSARIADIQRKNRAIAYKVYTDLLSDPKYFRDMLTKYDGKALDNKSRELARAVYASLERVAVQSAITSASDQERAKMYKERMLEINNAMTGGAQ